MIAVVVRWETDHNGTWYLLIAENQNRNVYVQVAYRIRDSEETIKRAFGPLLELKDHYPKYVVTLDDFWQDNIEGVKHVYLPDFLMMPGY